ncbi:hypothetical protein BDR26DRAFT_852640, partial [Obelidium mucronatum]
MLDSPAVDVLAPGSAASAILLDVLDSPVVVRFFGEAADFEKGVRTKFPRFSILSLVFAIIFLNGDVFAMNPIL